MLAARPPEVAQELADGASHLEREFRDVQDIEFTVEEGRLFFLQTRSAKRTPRAAFADFVDLVHEGLLDPATALARAKEIDLNRVGITRFADNAPAIARATSASPGVATGRIAFDSARAKELGADKEPVILVRRDTSTEDVAGFAVASEIHHQRRTHRACRSCGPSTRQSLSGRLPRIEDPCQRIWRRDRRTPDQRRGLDFAQRRNRRSRARPTKNCRSYAGSRACRDRHLAPPFGIDPCDSDDRAGAPGGFLLCRRPVQYAVCFRSRRGRDHRGCYGCFGPVDGANTAPLACEFAELAMAPRDIARLFQTFNAGAEAFRKEAEAHGD